MFRSAIWLILLAVGQAAAPEPRTATHTFDTAAPGAPPAKFTFAAMRQPQPGQWLLRRDGTNGYLAHDGDEAAAGLSLALAPDAPMAEGLAAVRIRFAGPPRAGGLVWRYVDPGNYYAAMLDLARANVSLFRVTDGNRVFLELEDSLELDPGAWHTLKVVQEPTEITVSLGGIRVFDERDRRADRRTPGRTGLIASGNARVWFDDLRIEPQAAKR